MKDAPHGKFDSRKSNAMFMSPPLMKTTLALLTLSFLAVTTQAVTLELVARKGETLTTEPVNAKFGTLYEPTVAASGHVAYRAQLIPGVAGINGNTAGGIWRDLGGARAQIARASLPVTGLTNVFFHTFADPVINSDGRVAFRAVLRGAGTQAGKNIGIFTDMTGVLALAARTGDAAAGVAGTVRYTAFSSVNITDDGEVIFQATIAGQGVTSANNTGLWSSVGGAETLVLRKGQPISAAPGAPKIQSYTIFSPAPFAIGQNRNIATDGGVTVLAVLSDQSTVLLKIRGGTFTVVAKKGDLLTTDPVNAKVAAIFLPAIGANGDIAWRSTLTPGLAGINTQNGFCIFHDSNAGTRTLMARSTFDAPGTGGAKFVAFSDPVINASGKIAFRATLKNAPGVPVGTLVGLWSDGLAPLSVVARQGSQPPGTNTGVKFNAFTQYVLPDSGGIAFLANITGTGVTPNNNIGVWATDLGGTLQLALRKSDKLNVGGVQKTVLGMKIFSGLPFVAGQGRSYSADGDLALLVTFTDNSHALYRVTFP